MRVRIMLDISKSMKEMHSQGIIYTDFKPFNVQWVSTSCNDPIVCKFVTTNTLAYHDNKPLDRGFRCLGVGP